MRRRLVTLTANNAAHADARASALLRKGSWRVRAGGCGRYASRLAMIRNVFLSSALYALVTTLGYAASGPEQRYIVGGGVGGVDCPNFVSTMDRTKKHGFGSVGYANETYGFQMYVLGFQTAYNYAVPNTCDIFGNYSLDQLMSWLENYCRARPLEKFGSGVLALAREIHPNRVRVCKP